MGDRVPPFAPHPYDIEAAISDLNYRHRSLH